MQDLNKRKFEAVTICSVCIDSAAFTASSEFHETIFSFFFLSHGCSRRCHADLLASAFFGSQFLMWGCAIDWDEADWLAQRRDVLS